MPVRQAERYRVFEFSVAQAFRPANDDDGRPEGLRYGCRDTESQPGAYVESSERWFEEPLLLRL